MTADPVSDKTELREPATGAPFGPGFFIGQLRAFARERCPDPGEGLPAVELHLGTGEVLDLCHVMGLAPGFVALAVRVAPRTGTREASMRTELVPYALITRVTIRPARATGAHVGFNLDHAPDILAHEDLPEATLRAAAALEGEDPDPEGSPRG